MPGITCLLSNQAGPIAPAASSHLDSLKATFPHLEIATGNPAPNAFVCQAQNAGYRVAEGDYRGWRVYHEMQDSPALAEGFCSLLDVLAEAPEGESELKSLWRKHLARYTGSFFLLAIHPESGRLVFANDALARLPVYLYRKGGSFALGRDISLIRAAAPSLSFNPLYLALFQMLGYIPGHGTYFNEIDTLLGGTLGVYDWGKDQLRMADQPELRIIEPRYGGSQQSRAEELAEAFDRSVASCKSPLPRVVSLSGGFDSRCVSASLHRQCIPFGAFTYIDPDGRASDEVTIANQVVAALGCEHRLMKLAEPAQDDFRKLFLIKSGLNYMVATYFLQHLEEILRLYPQGAVIYTGDGGDKTVRDLMPDEKLRDGRDWLNYWYSREAIFDPQASAEMFGLKRQDLDDYLLNLIAGYPTKDYSEKYAHIILVEQAARWSFEGEDRNRHYFRAEAPFYDYEFYKLGRQIPQAWKKDYGIYSRFLHVLSPQLSDIRYAYRKWKPSMMMHAPYRLLVSQTRKLRMRGKLRDAGYAAPSSYASHDFIAHRIMEQAQDPALLEVMPGVRNYVSPERLQSLNHLQLGNLYTVSSSIVGRT